MCTTLWPNEMVFYCDMNVNVCGDPCKGLTAHILTRLTNKLRFHYLYFLTFFFCLRCADASHDWRHKKRIRMMHLVRRIEQITHCGSWVSLHKCRTSRSVRAIDPLQVCKPFHIMMIWYLIRSVFLSSIAWYKMVVKLYRKISRN